MYINTKILYPKPFYFLGTFNSNLDRMIARIFEAQTSPNQKYRPVASLDAWPCGFNDVMCGPQVRSNFPINSILDRNAEKKDLITDSQTENERWWRENFQDFISTWVASSEDRLSQASIRAETESFIFSGIETWNNSKLFYLTIPELYDKNLSAQYFAASETKCTLDSTNQNSLLYVIEHIPATASQNIPHRLSQIINTILSESQDERYPCVRIIGKAKATLGYHETSHAVLLKFENLPKGEMIRRAIEVPAVLSPVSFPYDFPHGKAAKLAEDIFVISEDLRANLMKLISLSDWPHPSMKNNTNLVGMSIPDLSCKGTPVPLTTLAKILASLCKEVGATHALVNSFHHGITFEWIKTFETILKEHGIVLVSLEKYYHEDRRQEDSMWESQKGRLLNMLYAMTFTDIFVGSRQSLPDWLIYHLMLARQLKTRKASPKAYGISCEGLQTFLDQPKSNKTGV